VRLILELADLEQDITFTGLDAVPLQVLLATLQVSLLEGAATLDDTTQAAWVRLLELRHLHHLKAAPLPE